MWILGSSYREIAAFYGLALVLIVSAPWWYNKSSEAWILLLVAVGIDSAHVYASSFRTWFSAPEMKSRGGTHLMILSGIVALTYCWCVVGVPGFWSFVLYFTLFHHIRQFYGIHRLSLALNRPQGIEMGRELYALCYAL